MSKLCRLSRVLLACLLATPLWAEDKPAPPYKISSKVLEELAAEYQELGLPLPPPDARPLLLPTGSRYADDNKTLELSYSIGFRIKPGDGQDNPGTFLVGTERWDAGSYPKMRETPLPVDPDAPLTAKLDRGAAYFGAFHTDAWLSAVIQCQLRGYGKLAAQILERNPLQLSDWLVSERFNPPDDADLAANRLWYRATNGGDPRKALAAAAWNHWLNTLPAMGTDRREALARMEKLYKDHVEFRGKAREGLLASLRLTIQPNEGLPGSAEELIDQLTEDNVETTGRPIAPEGLPNPHLNKLLEMGFAAMPTLLAHLDDRRLMRGTESVVDGPTYLVTVGGVVKGLVEKAAGAQLYPPGTKPDLGEFDEAKLAHAWWENASKFGEEEYARDHVLPLEKRNDESQWINLYCLWTVAHKYPQFLGGIYERLLRERPDLDSDDVARFVGACAGLDREEKMRLLRGGAAQRDLWHRNSAIRAMLAVDPADAQARLRQELARLPAKASPARSGMSAEEEVVWTVRLCNAPEVWQALAEAARRAEPELRAALIQRVGGSSWTREFPAARRERVEFLSAFFDDPATWREVDKRGEPPEATGAHEDLTHVISNRTATVLGEILEIESYPNEYWDAQEWRDYRAAVRAAMEKMAAR